MKCLLVLILGVLAFPGMARAANVGIGTTAPGSLLTVSGADTAATFLANTPWLGIVNTDTTNNNAAAIAFRSTDTGAAIATVGKIGSQITSHSSGAQSGDLVFATRNAGTLAETMRISAAGNVGIGTTSPSEKFSVVSADNTAATNIARFYTNNLSQSVGIGFQDILQVASATQINLNAGTSGVIYLGNVSTGGTNIGLAGGNTILNASSGNVGIGTTSPGSLLQVGSGGATGKLVVDSQDSSYGEFQIGNPTSSGEASALFISGATAFGTSPTSTNGAGYIWNIGAGNYGIAGNKFSIANASYGGPILTVISSGNVGIGTTAPNEKFQVYTSAAGAVANYTNSAGTCTMTPASSGNGMACASDERLKRNIREVDGDFALDHILKLQAVSFEFKKAPETGRHTGYIAQKVKEFAPEFVRQGDDGFYQIYYDGFVPWITEAIKELHTKFTGLGIRADHYEEELASLKIDNAELKQKNALIKAYLCEKDSAAVFCQ